MRAFPPGGTAPLDMACFPLVPFSGRIGYGRFTWEGRTVELERGLPDEPHAIHGDGWLGSWTVTAQTDREAAMVFCRTAPWLPFRYRASQRFALEDGLLRASIAVTNLGERPMPLGIGLHPYFDRRPGVKLSADVQAVWWPDAAGIAHELRPIPPEFDFRSPREVQTLAMDHNFAGFSGRALIDDTAERRRLAIEADPVFGTLVVYVPPGQDFFCVEPTSHAADVVNMPPGQLLDPGLRVLAPGETLGGEVRFRVSQP
jgi:aldose 1-epimerase